VNEPRVFNNITALTDRVKGLCASPSGHYRAVCVDYFDTLVTRTVDPEQTKIIAASQLALLIGTIEGSTVYEMRRLLELRLCRESREEGADAEFSLPELAEHLYQVLCVFLGSGFWPAGEESFRQRLCAIELAVETSVQRPIADTVKLIEWLKVHGIPVYIVSDFYLPRPLFAEMTDYHGLHDLVTGIFVSADDKKTKGAGTLYHEVCSAIDIEPDRLLMIGDNPHADGAMACAAGLNACVWEVIEPPKIISRQTTIPSSEDTAGPGLLRELDATINRAAITFKEMAATLWWFTDRLFAYAREHNVRKLFFCSKEGEFLHQLFEQYQQMRFGGQVIDAHYLFVSRKATFIASLQPLGTETFARLFNQYRDLSLEEFVQSLNFTGPQIELLKNQLPLDWHTRVPDLRNHESFAALCAEPLFADMYETQRVNQNRNLRSYLGSFAIDFSEHGMHMVDVGWKGSIQNNIYYALQGEISLHGYYVGLLSPTELRANNRKTGILFSDYPNHSPYIHVFNNNRSLYEMMLGASHGSADGYFRTDEWEESSTQRDAHINCWVGDSDPIGVATLDLPEERRLFSEQIKPLQTVFWETFTAITTAVIHAGVSHVSLEWVARHHARMCFRPTREEVEFFSRLYHLENFGIFEFTRFSQEQTLPVRQRIRNFQELRRNPEAVLETGVWQPIIFRRLGLSWLQPLDGFKRHRRVFSARS
jgi:FMN phosphatase YigB (HAD superfamily)